jgi:hypothetical protein
MSETIEHGIPIPKEKKVGEGLEIIFPELIALQPSDSFVIPEAKFPTYIEIAMWGIDHGHEHEVRRLDNGDYRVWRVK